jgi:hypothetical protein
VVVRVIVLNENLNDLAGDLRGIADDARRKMPGVVRDAAKRGNRHAREFASEQHTMFSEVDAEYPYSFTVENVGRRNAHSASASYEYGPDSALPEGSKAPGYEWGSINQASPHRNLDRSRDIEAVEFPMDVSDEMRFILQRAGF